ncbi:hypothetical protein FRB97_009100, partial [Tulasnella sp. 331]
KASHYQAGVCDINTEITSPENDRFILHDSQGFEQGELDNLKTVKNFIEQRKAMPAQQDRIHAVWLCIAIPFAGGRLLEKGDEEFLQADFGSKKLEIMETEEYEKWSDDEADGHVDTAVHTEYEELCIKRLDEVSPERKVPAANVSIHDKKSIENLAKLTSGEIGGPQSGERNNAGAARPSNLNSEPARNQPNAVWLAWAVAQRSSADLSIEASIAIGKTRYWRALACSFQFKEKSTQQCLDLIHNDIVNAWNFQNPLRLYEADFKKEVYCIITDLLGDSSDRAEPNRVLSGGVAIISAAAPALVALASGPALPVALPLAVAAVASYYLYAVYQQTPPVLQALMGYIVNLTAILEGLFNLLQSDVHPQTLSAEVITDSINNYKGFKSSDKGLECHAEIRKFVSDTPNIFSISHRAKLCQELTRLIQTHRFRAVQEWMNTEKERRNLGVGNAS